MRPTGWEARLQQVLDRWGQGGCASYAPCADFAAEIVEAVSGRDVRPILGLPVNNAPEVMALYRRTGSRALADAVTVALGASQGALQAKRGDIVLARKDSALGACLGDRAAFLKDDGIIHLPMTSVAKSWGI